MRLSVGVASVNLMQSSVLPGADAVEAGVAGLRRDQGLGGRGAAGGRSVTRQRGHGVSLRLRKGQPVVRTVGTAAEPAVQLTEGEVSKETLRLPQGTTGGLGRMKRRKNERVLVIVDQRHRQNKAATSKMLQSWCEFTLVGS